MARKIEKRESRENQSRESGGVSINEGKTCEGKRWEIRRVRVGSEEN